MHIRTDKLNVSNSTWSPICCSESMFRHTLLLWLIVILRKAFSYVSNESKPITFSCEKTYGFLDLAPSQSPIGR